MKLFCDTPILLTGTFRSGTSFSGRVLNNHPNIKIATDTVCFLRFSFNKYNPITDKNNLEALIDEIYSRLKIRWNILFDKNDVIRDCLKDNLNYSTIWDSVMYHAFMKESNKNIWGEKIVLEWQKIPDFFKMYPKGCVVHTIRDPRDVLCSWKKMTNSTGNDYLDAIFNCIDSMNKAIEFSDLYKDKRYFVLKFEDFTSNSEVVLKKMCTKLNIAYEPNSMLDIKNFKAKDGGSWNSGTMFKDKFTKVSTKPVGRWKKYLSNEELYLVERFAGDIMKKYDYTLSKQKISNDLIRKSIDYLSQSKLASNGAFNYLINNEGVSRFPSNPLDPKNWTDEHTVR
tara:strand:+ start:6932 stop:7951 length:1020 start_codon:yes stop_codon:yes gene_type:complete